MDLKDSAIVGSIVSSVVAVGVSITSMLRGRDEKTEKADDIKARLKALEKRADKMDDSMSEVQRDIKRLPSIEDKLVALDRLISYRLDDLTVQLRAIAGGVGATVTLRKPEDRRVEARYSSDDVR